MQEYTSSVIYSKLKPATKCGNLLEKVEEHHHKLGKRKREREREKRKWGWIDGYIKEVTSYKKVGESKTS